MIPRLLLLLFLFLPGSLGAQEGQAEDEPLRAGGVAAFLMKAGTIANTEGILLGGWAGLTLGHRISLGGGGVALTREVELGASATGSGFELGVGYGGILFHYDYPLADGIRLRGGVLAGAGHAEVRDRLMGREVGADNFGILEPEAGISVSLLPWLHIGASGGVRMVWGVEDLPLVQKDDLQGMTGTLSLQVGGF